jgi:hypothetical protein
MRVSRAASKLGALSGMGFIIETRCRARAVKENGRDGALTDAHPRISRDKLRPQSLTAEN